MTSTGLPDGRIPVVLSSHAEELVAADAEAILRYLDRDPDVRAVAAALLRTRRLRRHRAVVRATDTAELADGLRAVIAGTDHPLVVRSSETRTARVAFVFPGQGNQWPSMGAQAYRQSAVYRAHVDRCAEAFVAAGESSPLPYLTAESTGGQWSQAQVQAAQFTHAVGLAHIWRSCGIQPDVVIGHSLGEVAAAYIAGSMALPAAAGVVIARAKAVDRLSGDYRMAALGVSLPDAERLMSTIPGWLEVSAVNAGASVAVSGQRAAVAALVAAATEQGLFARELDVNYPGHTSALERVRDDLRAMLPDAEFTSAPIHFIGSTTADVVPEGTGFTDYWYDNLRNTVRFDRAVAAARHRGAEAFIEMSAHPALLFALGDLLADQTDEPLVVGSGHRDMLPMETLSANISAVAVANPGYRWADLVDVSSQPPLRGFPNAPMRTARLWAEPKPLAPVYGVTVAREKWDRTTPSATVARRVAVVELTGPGGSLGDRLRTALRRSGSELVEARTADLVVAVAPELDHPDAERGAQEISGLIGAGLLDYVDAAGPETRAVCLVTVGGEHVRPGEPAALPAQAALAAMHRSIGFERPEQSFRHLDLPSWEPDDVVAAAAAGALLGGADETAIRDDGSGPEVFVRTVAESVEPAPSWQLDGNSLADVVITGGNGAVGLHFARYLAAHGARRIVLLSRSGVDAAVVAELAAAQVDVVAPRCDVTSAEQIAAAAGQFGGDGASLLIHAAGAAAFTDRDALTPAAFAETSAAKIGGLARMTELWPMRPDARILLCSSVSGVWGGRGHAAYSAANRMLDVMAGQLRAKGQHCLAARYGLWRGIGIAGAGEVTRIERSGLLPMTPDAAVEATLRDHGEDPLLLSADQGRLRMFLESRSADTIETRPATSEADVDTAARVRTELAAVLNLEPASIDLDMSLLDMGVDSLLALDLRKRLLRTSGRKVPLATLLGGITGGELVADLNSTERSEKVDNA
ncbi:MULTISPECIES: mycobactin polyketide synthase MbtD [unclassified Mycobacterium]|uniref:mycobactin polyketide synthase MbtD n=1 Tax=unclassified Mycobacterium TaxID=2642494 RepID=UPI00073FC2CB|nr:MULTISPECIES: mycobactin polyketide synthase MbtD [unclassified Mycobacterium]KUH80537.1 polyketide synthase [Mycobacterium sp. GA-1999]KUH89226.1 polyketide synthase [Mycobacterium sp. GA-0227b]KUH95902.1 polyketide synthase [Mycobacterium sp. IS-1556]